VTNAENGTRVTTNSTEVVDNEKQAVHDFWNASSCGEVYAEGDNEAEAYRRHAKTRYELEPYISEFARFDSVRGLDVLEIGVGLGADHQRLAEAGPQSLTGIDLTERAIAHTRKRFDSLGLQTTLQVDDAERLSFPIECFDVVYSWGVIHHSPDTERVVGEIHRVLRPGGVARVMIYHKWSVVGFLLWIRYALMRGKPGRSLAWLYSTYLESPGTKAYTRSEGARLFAAFRDVETKALLSFGDLLLGASGQRHQGPLLAIARMLWPRRLLRQLLGRGNFGLYLLIEARK